MMAEQLEDLAEMAALAHIFVRILPLDVSRGAIIGSIGHFVLMNLSDEDVEDGVVYSERLYEDQIGHDAQVILPYREAFEDLWKLSLPEDASLRLISYVAQGLRVRLDRLPATGEE